MDQAIHDGTSSFAIAVDTPADSRWFELGGTSAPPAWDGGDTWPVVRVEGVAPAHAGGGSLCGDAFESGDLGAVTLSIALVDYGFLRLVIHHARVSMQVEPAAARGGVISGILDPAELQAELHRVAYAVDPSLCYPEVPFDPRTAADIMLDGSNGDPSKTCDGISIGLGFDAVAATLGAQSFVPGIADPCP